MPTYVYEVVLEDGQGGEKFEVVQQMSEDPLTEHPETGEPVRRVFQAVNIGGRWSDSRAKKNLGDDKKLERLGFTKYVNQGNGKYEKALGDGPDIIKK